MALVNVGNDSNRSISPQSSEYSKQQPTYQSIYVGEVIFNTATGDIIQADGEFKDNQHLSDGIYAIVNTLRLHMLMKQSGDVFKGATIQFSDHYYKINMAGEATTVHKYLLNFTTVNA